eukprot:gb/GECG01014970.1/.p1 GENE.gb/GECG01014970.1/~~gb/GECG01014970.1/.p1  ORF type:complete len:220 (+),score=13.66 gb/GECG01014970.1/:1-660(+)
MSRKEDYSKDVWAFVMPSFVGVYESSLRRAVFACYHRKDKQPPKLTRKPPVFLQFEDATVEDAYHEWSGAENSRKTLRSLGVILLCLGMYYWATDWVNWVQEGSSDSIKRLVSRGYVQSRFLRRFNSHVRDVIAVCLQMYPSFGVHALPVICLDQQPFDVMAPLDQTHGSERNQYPDILEDLLGIARYDIHTFGSNLECVFKSTGASCRPTSGAILCCI